MKKSNREHGKLLAARAVELADSGRAFRGEPPAPPAVLLRYSEQYRAAAAELVTLAAKRAAGEGEA